MNMRWTNGAVSVSRRGLFLILIGAIYAIIGSSYASEDIPTGQTGPDNPYVAALATGLGWSFWGTLWAFVGVLAIAAGFGPRYRDHYGFYALAAWSTGWAVLCEASTFVYGADRGWVAGLIWLTFGAVCIIVSGMDGIGTPPTEQVSRDRRRGRGRGRG
jgi:hypothetical protein